MAFNNSLMQTSKKITESVHIWKTDNQWCVDAMKLSDQFPYISYYTVFNTSEDICRCEPSSFGIAFGQKFSRFSFLVACPYLSYIYFGGVKPIGEQPRLRPEYFLLVDLQTLLL